MAGQLHTATISWRRDDGDFARGRYSRRHIWHFDGGIDVAASAAPSVVPKPYAVEEAVDAEEAFVAAISACHMLTFVDIARHAGFVTDSYDDAAAGELTKLPDGRSWISRVTLRPRTVFSGDKRPTADELDILHHRAHELCFIANSVKTEIVVEAA